MTIPPSRVEILGDEAVPELVDVRNFLCSVRETGYRSFAHAIAELVDNSIQADATQVSIRMSADEGGRIAVVDNGTGMSRDSLRTALQFGGSTRYGDRNGSGRFGMGLPTSSLSLARRVDVYTWRHVVLHAFLDVDELRSTRRPRLPEPKEIPWPSFVPRTDSGTMVVLSKCDQAGRLDNVARTDQTIFELRRIFRYPLEQRLKLELNGANLSAFDPLFLNAQQIGTCAAQYGPILEYRVPAGQGSGLIQVRFSELPVRAWRNLSNIEKQTLGISRGAGVSVVRNRREIAYGWYFLGAKRRENYDDWWRCEVSFAPDLDEYFRVNHTKQQISPIAALDRLLTPDIENVARILNSRVRQEFVASAQPRRPESAKAAAIRDKYLPSLLSPENTPLRDLQYRFEIDATMVDNTFYRAELQGPEIAVFLNPHHPVTSRFLAAKGAGGDAVHLCEYLLLAAARAELAATSSKARWWFRHFRTGWSDTLATFLGN